MMHGVREVARVCRAHDFVSLLGLDLSTVGSGKWSGG